MKVGDLIQLSDGPMQFYDLPTGIAILAEKLPREDFLEYDWNIFVDGKFIVLGRLIEDSSTKVLNESRRFSKTK